MELEAKFEVVDREKYTFADDFRHTEFKIHLFSDHPQHQIRTSQILISDFIHFATKYNSILSIQQPGSFGEKASNQLCKKRSTNVRYKSPKCGKAFATWFCYLFIYLLQFLQGVNHLLGG